MNYYRIINRNNLQFDFLFFRDSNLSYEEEIRELGGNSYTICNPKNVILFRKELKLFLENHKNEYEIVHIHDAIFARFMYDIIKKAGIKQVIIHSHATNYSDRKLSGLRNSLLCHNIHKYADTLFACSNAAGRFMFSQCEFYVMNNAICIQKYQFSPQIRSYLRKKMNLLDCFVVGHVGAFVNQKNHVFLLDIFSEIIKKIPNSILLLAGDGPLFHEIKEKANVLGIQDRILFLGKRSDVDELYQVMDMFVLPSLFEGLPMVGVEAQCAGLPIVMSNEITTEACVGNCLFIDLSENKEIWAEKIIDLYKKSKRNREEAVNAISLKGFDIAVETKKLEMKYYELVRG